MNQHLRVVAARLGALPMVARMADQRPVTMRPTDQAVPAIVAHTQFIALTSDTEGR